MHITENGLHLNTVLYSCKFKQLTFLKRKKGRSLISPNMCGNQLNIYFDFPTIR